MLKWGEKCIPIWTESELKEKIANAKSYSNPGSIASDPVENLEFINSELFEVTPTKGAPILKKLANFEAKIVKEENIFDGDVYEKEFHIHGKTPYSSFSPVTILAEVFPQMNWTTKNWGADAIIAPGNGVKDKVRAAIQHYSKDAKLSTVYSHLGWSSTKPPQSFIHAAGFIGSTKDAEVRITNENLSNYRIVKECSWDLDSIESFLDMGPDHITLPLLAIAFRSPLNNWIKPDFSVFLAGSTGTRKSELCAMAQSFYGSAFTRTSLPANWSSTANALEKAAFLAKDCLLVIDDFTPTGTQSDIAKLNQSAERLFRGVGNSSGRARLNRQSVLMNSFTPRSLLLSSGEDIPTGHSLRARLLVINVEAKSVHLDLLTLVQKNASEGIHVSIMHPASEILSQQNLLSAKLT